MSSTQVAHPAVSCKEPERRDYLILIAMIAGADHMVTPEESSTLQTHCDELKLEPSSRDTVMAAAEHRPADLESVTRRLSSSDLRFTLVTDCCWMALADERVAQEECDAIDFIAARMNVNAEQVDAIWRYVRAAHGATKDGSGSNRWRKAGEVMAANLAAVGVPVGAIAILGAPGLSPVAITPGLADLGQGLGMASGIGLAIGLGLGTYVGVKKLVEWWSGEEPK